MGCGWWVRPSARRPDGLGDQGAPWARPEDRPRRDRQRHRRPGDARRTGRDRNRRHGVTALSPAGWVAWPGDHPLAAAVDLAGRVRNNPAVPLRRLLAAALLLVVTVVTAAMPQWLGLGAHVLEHSEESAADHVAGLAQALIHGHEHGEGVPEHEHRLLSAPSMQSIPPRDLQALTAVFLASLSVESLVPPGLRPSWQGADSTGFPGSGPPRLQLLCTLLI